MKVRIQLLYRGEVVTMRLLHDGWRLTAESINTLTASHVAVDTEPAARRRLNRLGLLTSACMRIAFPLPDLRCGECNCTPLEQAARQTEGGGAYNPARSLASGP